MTTPHTQTEPKHYDVPAPSKVPQFNIEDHREKLRGLVKARQEKEEAILAALDAHEAMAVQVVAAIMKTCEGIINAEAVPTDIGYIITAWGVPKVTVSVPKYGIEPHRSVSVVMSTPAKKFGPTASVHIHDVDTAVNFAVRELCE